MDSSLPEVWQAAGASSAFLPAIAKQSQFTVAFILLLIGLLLAGFFALSMCLRIPTITILIANNR